MTQLLLQIEDAKLLPAIKKVFSTMKGVHITTVEESTYDETFVRKIEKSLNQEKTGKVKTIKTEDLWK